MAKKLYRYGMRARPFGMGTFPQQNENVVGPCPDNKREESGFWDVLITTQPLSKQEIASYELVNLNHEDMDIKVMKIAKKILNIENLETQNTDSADFHELHVAEIKEALETAYRLGRNQGL